MFCGISSFRHIDGEDPLAPSRSKREKKHSKIKIKTKNKNPYSSIGLDKFTSVLSDLESRREKIMSTAGAQGITMVRFMYSNSHDWIPIIVRLPDKSNNKVAVTSPKKPAVVEMPSPPQPPAAVAAVKMLKWMPGYCVPVMMVLILVCLVIFGRVFGICCATIWWYVVPNLEGAGRMRRRVSRKADYVKKMSSKRLPVAAPPQAKGGGVQELVSPRGRSRKMCDV